MKYRENDSGSGSEVSASAVPVEATAGPVGRRELAALVGALAGLVATGCANGGEGEVPVEELGTITQAATGTALKFVDTVVGELATKNSAALGNPIVVIAQNYAVPGDRGGGVFYWEPISGGGNGGTIIAPTGPTGGGGRWVRIYSGPLDVRWFGARAVTFATPTSPPNPDYSSAGAIQDAINAAGAVVPGQPLPLGGVVYFPPGIYLTNQRNLLANVTLMGAGPTTSILRLQSSVNEGILSASSAHGCGLRDLGFYGANEAQGGSYIFQPLCFGDCNNIQIDNIRLHRGTGADKGAMDIAAGLKIVRGKGHRLHKIEVTGDGLGDGIHLDDATSFELVDAYVHDMAYTAAAVPGDDVIEGIRLSNCSEFVLDRPRVHDLGGKIAGSQALNPRRSRAIALGGNTQFSIHSPNIARVDQGLDITGDGNYRVGGNTLFEVTGGVVVDCYSWGYKFANCARDGNVTGCVAVRCGMAGFVASPPLPRDPMTPGPFVVTSDLTFVGCTAHDCGGTEGTPCGFRVLDRPNSPGGLRGIRFIGCRAIDRRTPAVMEFGFHSEIEIEGVHDVAIGVLANEEVRYNECIDCVSLGHKTSAFCNMNEPRCEVWLSANQQISSTTSTWTVVKWTADSDLGAMHDKTPNNNSNIIARRTGTYSFHFGVEFQYNGAGVRGLRILENGVVIRGATVIVNATTSSVTALNLSFLRKCKAGTSYSIEVLQDSNAQLDLTTASGGVVEQVA